MALAAKGVGEREGHFFQLHDVVSVQRLDIFDTQQVSTELFTCSTAYVASYSPSELISGLAASNPRNN
jgi:hypothetical protein